MNVPNLTATRTAARRFADRRRDAYPKAVGYLRDDLPARFRYPVPDERRQVRTTNAIERRLREVRRRTRPMGTNPILRATRTTSTNRLLKSSG